MIREAIEQCEILRNASPASKAKMISYGILKKITKNEMLFREREEVDRIYFMISGYVALYRITKNHDCKIIFIKGAGAALNEVILEEPVASISCMALSDVQVASFSRKQILEIMETDIIFTRLLMNSMAKKIRRLYHQLGNTSNMMHLEQQVASKLWKTARDFGVEKETVNESQVVVRYVEIPFDLSITFLADMVGSKRETVSRIMKVFANDGILRIEKKRCQIYDINKLKNIIISEKTDKT